MATEVALVEEHERPSAPKRQRPSSSKPKKPSSSSSSSSSSTTTTTNISIAAHEPTEPAHHYVYPKEFYLFIGHCAQDTAFPFFKIEIAASVFETSDAHAALYEPHRSGSLEIIERALIDNKDLVQNPVKMGCLALSGSKRIIKGVFFWSIDYDRFIKLLEHDSYA